MSTKYKNPDEVPTEVICARLEELSDAVNNGRESVAREFVMRIPGEWDHDADLVLYEAAERLRNLDKEVRELKEMKQYFLDLAISPYKKSRHVYKHAEELSASYVYPSGNEGETAMILGIGYNINKLIKYISVLYQ